MKKALLPIILTFFSIIAHAQVNNSASERLVKFARNAAIFSMNYTQEKVYLHFDNTSYFLGETIWFKAYIVNSLNNHPSDMSKTLHVELLSPEGNIIITKKLRINNGVCSGDFQLQDSLPGGFYEVRAYTRCMMNFGPEVAFSRVFPIFDKPKEEGFYSNKIITTRKYDVPNRRSDNPNKDAINVSFFPEGGALVKGLTSNVAFKAIDKQGRSINITGVVYDENEMEVAKLSTKYKGMGSFSLKTSSKKYTVKVKYNNKEDKFTLPVPEESGYTMSYRPINPDSLMMDISKSDNLSEKDSLALIVTCRGKLIDFYTLTIPSTGKSIAFKTTKYPAGVYQFTLYDVEGRARSERLVFKYPKKTANLYFKTDKPTYNPYEKVKLTLFSDDTLSTKTGSSISLAVRDKGTSNFGTSDNSTIATNLLLSSDIKGYIENPTWYFAENTPDRIEALNLLMMTQGWRRYSWEYMSGVKPFVAKHPIEEGILIDGEVRSLLLKTPLPNIELQFWMTRGKSSQQGKILTDSLGRFSFITSLYDEWILNLHTSQEKKRKETRILLNRVFSPEAQWLTAEKQDLWTDNKLQQPDPIDSVGLLLGQIHYSSENSRINAEGLREIKLKEVVTTGKKITTFVQEAARNASIAYDMEKEADALRDVGKSEAPSVIDMLLDTNPYFNTTTTSDSGTTYRYKGKKAVFQIFRNSTQNQFGYTETVGIDELTVEDVEKILIIEDNETLHTSNPQYDGSYVLFLVFMYGDEKRKIPLGLRTTKFQGYAIPREFYSPTYQPEVPVTDPDYRRTLYWNSDIIIGPNGNITIEFNNNASCKSMDVSAEGITSNGTLLQN
jgi:hypothetical protein